MHIVENRGDQAEAEGVLLHDGEIDAAGDEKDEHRDGDQAVIDVGPADVPPWIDVVKGQEHGAATGSGLGPRARRRRRGH